MLAFHKHKWLILFIRCRISNSDITGDADTLIMFCLLKVIGGTGRVNGENVTRMISVFRTNKYTDL